MRPDFIKVLTERPRRRSGDCYHDVRPRARVGEDDAGGIEGMRRPYGYNTKDFSDLIGPMYRFLHSRVGQPWNKVHSEICEHLKGRSTQQQHLMDHVEQAVTTDLYVKDGKLWAKPMRWTVSERPFSAYGGNNDFFVDPRDGILKRCKPRRAWWKRADQKVPVTAFIDDDYSYKLVDGIWYEIELKFESWPVYSFTIKGERQTSWMRGTREYKRQLSTKELKGLGIKNAT